MQRARLPLFPMRQIVARDAGRCRAANRSVWPCLLVDPGSTAAAALASDHTRRTHKEWPPRGVTVGVQYTIAAQRAASTTSTMNGAQARSAARHIKVYQPIDEQRQRHRAKPPICFLNRCAARRALDKPIGSRHGPRARPCRVRVSCTSHGRTAPRRRKKPCYYSASKGNVRNCSSFPSARLQLLPESKLSHPLAMR